MKFYNYIFIGLLLIALGFLHFWYNETKWVKSDVDNNMYLIASSNLSHDKQKENANTLAEINKRILLLIEQSKFKYPKLKELYKTANLYEAAIDNRYTTFTVDKTHLHVCLRTRDNHKNLYDINKLMYIVIHELAHMANWDINGYPIIGHGKEFVRIFRDLLKTSIDLGIYTYQDYSVSPTEYCGIMLNSNVL